MENSVKGSEAGAITGIEFEVKMLSDREGSLTPAWRWVGVVDIVAVQYMKYDIEHDEASERTNETCYVVPRSGRGWIQ